jgi:hypothetical protein
MFQWAVSGIEVSREAIRDFLRLIRGLPDDSDPHVPPEHKLVARVTELAERTWASERQPPTSH